MNNSALKVIFIFILVMCVSISCKKEKALDTITIETSSTSKRGYISARNNNSNPQQIEFTNTQVYIIQNQVVLSTDVYGGTMSFAFDLNIEPYSLTPSFSNTSAKLCKKYNNDLLEVCVPELGVPQQFTPTKFDIVLHDRISRKIEGVFEMGILYTYKSGGGDQDLIEMKEGIFVVEY